MRSILQLIRDIDLESIRAAALGRFELWVVAERAEDADAVRALLGPGGAPHPWVQAVSPGSVAGPIGPPPAAALLVTPTPELAVGLVSARNTLRAALVPVVTVAVGDTSPAASLPRVGEDARVAVASLDADAARAVAASLIARFDDDRRVALARHLPPLRAAYFDAVIQETAKANAAFALTTGVAETVPVLSAPLAVGDIFVLTKNQLLMSYRIGVAAGRSGEPRALIGEILGVLGGGLLFRQAARQLVGLIPVAGIIPKVAVAYAGTVAIGRAIALWATEGQAVTSRAVRTLTREGLSRGRDIAEQLARTAGAAAGRAERELKRRTR